MTHQRGVFPPDTAFGRIIEHFQVKRPLTWDQPAKVGRLRQLARERLGGRSAEQQQVDTLALADARLLIARSEGFTSWNQLEKYIAGC